MTLGESAPRGERSIYRGKVVEVLVLDERWEVVRHAEAVAILALDGAGRVLFVEQPRPAIGRRSLELPAGLIDAGETPLQAAARELAEEAQLAGDLRFLAAAFVSPGFTDERVHLFHATDLEHSPGTPEADEELTLHWIDPQEAWERLHRGEVATSMVTLLGLQHALRPLQQSPREAKP